MRTHVPTHLTGMAAAAGEIEAFLSGGGDGDESRRLDVATLFAGSMLRELRSSVAAWEATAVAIERAREARDRRQRSASPGAPPFPGPAA